MKKTRKHQDYIYEAENYCKHPKETFIFLANLISPLPFSKNFNPSRNTIISSVVRNSLLASKKIYQEITKNKG